MAAKKSILITGGLGNLGSWLTTHFVKQGYEVSVLAKNKRPILQDLDFEFIQCDIANLEECKSVFKNRKFDVIIHAASISEGAPDEMLKINALGTRNILESIDENGVKHFIKISTFQVYGKYSGEVSENSPLETKNDYGNTHLFSEQYVKQFYYSKNIPYTIVRLTNSYGCPKDINSSKWHLILNDLSRMAVEQKKIELKSNGKAPRDFIWMGDVCSILEKIVVHGALNDTFNISTETTYRLLDLAKMVQNAYKEYFGEEIEVITNENDKSTFDEPLVVKSSKLRSVIDFKLRNKIEEEAQEIFKFIS